jgi:uncharacterized protein (DUF2267 family)
MRARAFVRRVALVIGGDDERAREVSLVVLAALSARLGAAESEHLAMRLPPDLAHAIRRDRRGLPRLDGTMVVSRVADELRCDLATAVKMIFAVYGVVEEVIAEPALQAEARATS